MSRLAIVDDMLRPCPFCGARVRLKSVDNFAFCRIVTIKCPRCGVEVTMEQNFRMGETNLVPVDEHPVTTWNRRRDYDRLLRNQTTRQ